MAVNIISLYSTTHTALIKQLYTDGHITAKEAAEITSKKLFTVPVSALSFQHIINAIDNIGMTTMTSSNFSTELCIRTVETTTNTTFCANAHLNNVSVSAPCTVVLGEQKVLPQLTCMQSNFPCVAVETCDTNKTKTMITSEVIVPVPSDEGLQTEKYVNDATTTLSLKNIYYANGRNIPHQITIVSADTENMNSSTTINTVLSVHDVQESSSIEGKKTCII